jgi:DinB superfamily/Pentapeptide repeats (8 copies)
MGEHFKEDLSGSRFEEVDFSGSWFHNVYFQDVVMRGAWLERIDIDGEVRSVVINGVDVAPFVEAELDRRDPDRVLVRATDADGYRAAWDMLERRWSDTVARARTLPEELLHERVDGEWSFIETLRHLVFATDAWVLRAYLGDPTPYHPLGLPHTEMEDLPGVPNDGDARPTLDEALAARAERMAVVRRVLADLTDERLAESTRPVTEPGYPESESYAVSRCLGAILSEEWEHRRYAERDLAVLEARQA